MALELALVRAGTGWAIVDQGVSGWRTIERHGDKSVAEARFKYHQKLVEADRESAPTTDTPTVEQGEAPTGPASAVLSPADKAVMAALDGTVEQVIGRIEKVNNSVVLERWLRLEEASLERRAVVEAISAQAEALAPLEAAKA